MSTNRVTSPAFTELVISGMRQFFPETLADKSWDNVGLLWGNTVLPGEKEKERHTVMLTNDLTYLAAEEAVKGGASVVVSYHPIIFRGLKSVTTADPQQATLLLLARENIAVYSPHTALDAAKDGINTWLLTSALGPSITELITPIKPITPLPAGISYGGYGAKVTAPTAIAVSEILKNVARISGTNGFLNVAAPPELDLSTVSITKAAVCAGSGADILRGVDAEIFITGEMSHHDALAMVQAGKIVVTVFHSNSERMFLKERLQPLLEGWLKEKNGDAKVFVSEVDRDPFKVVEVAGL